jgi:hypothetical protein
MNPAFLFKEPNKWILKDGYWMKENAEITDSAFDENDQSMIDGAFQVSTSWYSQCRINFLVSLIDKYFSIQKSDHFTPPQTGYFSR